MKALGGTGIPCEKVLQRAYLGGIMVNDTDQPSQAKRQKEVTDVVKRLLASPPKKKLKPQPADQP
ncbi:hypothetical protein DFAR_630061 [Desulfarculales bacterium]